MAGRGKWKQCCSKGLSQRLEKEDRISQLPDPLICQILSHLPPNENVKTSVLSSRWTSLWLWVPRLELAWWHFDNFNAFKSFGDKFFDSNRSSCIEKLKLAVKENRDYVDDDASYLKSWIDAAVKRKIQHLDVWCSMDEMMPLRLYNCETLVSLKLCDVTLDDVDSFSLPFLKSMQLKFIWYRKEATFERLVSSCPVLEKLKIVDRCRFGNGKVFQVLSRSLKKLIILIGKKDPKLRSFLQDSGTRFVIDAPRLRFLRVDDKLSESFIINDMDFNAKVDISLPFGLDVFDEASISSRRSSIRSFLPGISKVEEMTICRHTFKVHMTNSTFESLLYK
ncbi:putative FBD-associated F-box protein [Cardamine amara subsp. amara]|uniref:FBD-associated F-box protein n=1 Tax=Cardamine amara subsp. amara TaxID=228776 RepID=A0ABD1AIL9_CARAN